MRNCIIKGHDCSILLESINAYIAKADDNLSEELANAGYVDAKDSVNNASGLEDDLSNILTDQTARIAEALEGVTTLASAEKILDAFFDDDSAKDEIRKLFSNFYMEHVLGCADSYIRESSGDLVVTQLRKRTSVWINDWSDELSDLMQLNAEDDIGRKLKASIDEGKSVADFTQELIADGIRNEQYTARRAAVTEMLRCHSVAHDEAMAQDPAVVKKKWVHTGGYKNQPRANHVAMDGQIVDKDKPFKLTGADGVTYYPMYPRDPILPAGESINCKCLSQAIADEEILGMSLEERQKMQQKIIDEDDGLWEKELNAKNKAKAGIGADEAESSKPKFDYKQSVIDRKQIASADYQNKFNNLGEKKKVTRSIRAKTKEMLRHRSGTNYEDLAYINTKTGKSVINKSYNRTASAKPSKAMTKLLKDADEYTVVGVHNHPNSTTPSINDIRAAEARKYKYGLVAGHNGTICKYTINGPVNYINADIYLEKANALLYNGDIDSLKATLEELSKNGVDLEVF